MLYEQQNYSQCRDILCQSLRQRHMAEHFGGVLKRARIEARFLTVESLSEAIYYRCGAKCSPRSIYRYENGTSTPSLDCLVALSLVLGLKVFSDLLTEVLSPGIMGKLEYREQVQVYDNSQQMKLFR